MPPKSVEPPWYGPVCPVVWEGWSREAPPYPDWRQQKTAAPTNGQGGPYHDAW